VSFASLTGYMRDVRWRWFVAPDRVGVLRVIAITQVAVFINWLVPLRVGELVKSLLLRRLSAMVGGAVTAGAGNRR